MKLIMENWKRYLKEEKVCSDGSEPKDTTFSGGTGKICRDGSRPDDDEHLDFGGGDRTISNNDSMGDDTPWWTGPLDSPPAVLPGTLDFLRLVPAFRPFIEQVQHEMRAPKDAVDALTAWNGEFTAKVARKVKDSATARGRDIAKEFKYAGMQVRKKAQDFENNHLRGENATHKSLWRQIKKDLSSLF